MFVCSFFEAPTGLRRIDILGSIASFGRGGRGECRKFDFIDIGEVSLGAVGNALENRERPLPGVSGSIAAIFVCVGKNHNYK